MKFIIIIINSYEIFIIYTYVFIKQIKSFNIQLNYAYSERTLLKVCLPYETKISYYIKNCIKNLNRTMHNLTKL